MDATRKGLEGFPAGSVILILGGRDKHGDFSEVEELREVGGFPPALLERIEPRIIP